VRELHKKPELDLIHKMALYEKYKVNPRHLVPLYAQLCARDTALTLEESKILGIEACVIINTARERLRANPSDEGRSPLPDSLEDGDIFRAIEVQIGLEEGSTEKFKAENPTMSLPGKLFSEGEVLFLIPTFIVDPPVGNGDRKSGYKFNRRGTGHMRGR